MIAHHNGVMEFLVETTITQPDGLSTAELDTLRADEAERARQLAEAGILLAMWRPVDRGEQWKNIGLWSAENATTLQAALSSLPLSPWMTFAIRELEGHPNDPRRDVAR